MGDQKTKKQNEISPDVQQTPSIRQPGAMVDPIAREEMSDSMGAEWDLNVAKNDGAAPAGADGQSRSPLAASLLSAFDETLNQEKNERVSTRIRGLFDQLKQRIHHITQLPEEERATAINALSPLIEACKEAFADVQDSSITEGPKISDLDSILSGLDALAVDPLS